MKKLFAVLVLGLVAVIGCEQTASTNKPKPGGTPPAANAAAQEGMEAKEKMAKEAGAKAKAEAEAKAKADADKGKPADADKGKTPDKAK